MGVGEQSVWRDERGDRHFFSCLLDLCLCACESFSAEVRVILCLPLRLDGCVGPGHTALSSGFHNRSSLYTENDAMIFTDALPSSLTYLLHQAIFLNMHKTARRNDNAPPFLNSKTSKPFVKTVSGRPELLSRAHSNESVVGTCCRSPWPPTTHRAHRISSTGLKLPSGSAGLNLRWSGLGVG